MSFLADTADDRGPYGRTLHFGIREHAMGSTMNGIALHGGTRPVRRHVPGLQRLHARRGPAGRAHELPVIYVWTHDSIGLGGDGPTHQPIEHLAALRAIPGLDVVRPADANETAVAWRTMLEQYDRPAALALSRQNLPTLDRSEYAGAEGTAKGAYVLAEASSGTPQVILIATGSEVSPRAGGPRDARGRGHAHPGRVDAVPRVVPRAGAELPADGAAAQREGAGLRRGRGVAGLARLRGDAGECISVEHFGASAPYKIIYEQFGITPERSGRRGALQPVQGRGHPGLHHRQLTVTRKGSLMTDPLRQLSDAGVAVWLDDLSRDRLQTGNLSDLIRDRSVVGITTNPTIFQKAISGSDLYNPQLHDLAVRGVDVGEALRSITTKDVRDACDVLRPAYDAQRRGRRPGVDRGRPADLRRRRQDDRRGAGTVVARRPARTCSSRFRPPWAACRPSARRCPKASASTSR